MYITPFVRPGMTLGTQGIDHLPRLLWAHPPPSLPLPTSNAPLHVAARTAHAAHTARIALRLALNSDSHNTALSFLPVLLFFLLYLNSCVRGRDVARSALSCHVMPCNVKWRPKSDPGSFFFPWRGSPHVAASLPIGPALYPKHSHPKHHQSCPHPCRKRNAPWAA